MRARNFQVLCIDMASIAVCLHQIIPQNDLKEKNQKEIYLSVDPKIASSSWFGTLLEHGCNKVNRLERTDIILPNRKPYPCLFTKIFFVAQLPVHFRVGKIF